MLNPEQITAIGAVLSPLVVGVVAMAGFLHERRQRKRDRRMEFQRDSIISLQESVWDLRRKTSEMIGELRLIYFSMTRDKWKEISCTERHELFKRIALEYWDGGREMAFIHANQRSL